MFDKLLDQVHRLIADADDYHTLTFETFLERIEIRDASAAGQARGGKYLQHDDVRAGFDFHRLALDPLGDQEWGSRFADLAAPPAQRCQARQDN